MPNNHLFYWDANIFLSYLNNEPTKVPTLEAILEIILQSKRDKIVTSVLSKVEVAWVATEKLNRALDVNEEARIDDLMNDSSVIELIDFNEEVTHIARSLLRRSMTKGWGLRTNDAIHLATAEWVGAYEMNTYDDRLFKYSDFIGLEIKIPSASQPKLL
jgi:predicted nucleic acid-binding protein